MYLKRDTDIFQGKSNIPNKIFNKKLIQMSLNYAKTIDTSSQPVSHLIELMRRNIPETGRNLQKVYDAHRYCVGQIDLFGVSGIGSPSKC